MRSLADDLRGRTDEELVALLRARPDLARPAPADVTGLAARATTRASVQRALDGLDLAHLHALEAVVVAAPAQPSTVAALLDTSPEQAAALVDRLRHLALCWTSPEGVRPARPVVEVIGDPAGLGPVVPGVPEDLDTALADLDQRRHGLLTALAWGPPVGALGGTGPVAQAVHDLLGAGLLARVDEGHVVLPRQVALALRGGRLHRRPGTLPPQVEAAALDPDVVDAAAGGRAGELIELVTELLDELSARPPRVLRSGGLSVRDLTRLSRHLEVEQPQGAWLLETALTAGLLAADDGGRRTGDDVERVWAPTESADDWGAQDPGERWAVLARAWWSTSAAPSLVGAAEGGRVNVLSVATAYPPARQRRHDTLAALAALPPGSAPGHDGLTELLRWRHPLRAARWSEQAGIGPETVLREAEWAAVTGRGALAGPGRALLTDPAGPAAPLAMAPLVPPAVEHVLLQADLTAVAPGRLDGHLRTVMRLVADVESRGGATVHRITENSVRRALDLGWSADRVLEELAEASRTPVPQPLDYLVRDVSRRHGLARVGTCAAYLRCDDGALLDRIEHDRALGMLQWRRLAPTVLVSPVPAGTVLDLLRDEQYGPVADTGGGGLDLATDRRRRAPRPAAAPVRVSGVDEVVARQVVGVLRRGERSRPTAAQEEATHTDPVVVTATLREAAADGTAVWIGYADDVGGVLTHLVRPLEVEGGRVRAGVGEGDVTRTFSLHRVTTVRPAT